MINPIWGVDYSREEMLSKVIRRYLSLPRTEQSF